MSIRLPLPSRYDPREIEDSIYQMWEKSGFFNPDTSVKQKRTKETAPAFSIVLPPPNVTGRLHVGHAAMLAVEDILVRYHRMKGDRTLWVPGTDHAAIATQSVVERALYQDEHKTRHDLGREAFLKRVEAFASESHDTIIGQLKKMGASLDWSREAYTLDQKRNYAVRTAFKRMYDDGLIYRGARIVNWDPKMQTAISDDEVERKEERSAFYYLQYGPFVIGTARPETKFGDKYVVMHPDDKRYKKYAHGQTFELEWINGPVVATVIKDKAIDIGFGTGVMTITPWHDAVDFEIAERHNLPKEQVIDLGGKLLPIAGEFAGMRITKARPLIVEKLKAKGLISKTEENYVHNIAVSSRGGGIIEPQIVTQWFVAVHKPFVLKRSSIKGIKDGANATLKELMQRAVRSKQIEIIPKRFEKTYFHWIDNLRDWCISRQLWYGHRIPVWYCVKSGSRDKTESFGLTRSLRSGFAQQNRGFAAAVRRSEATRKPGGFSWGRRSGATEETEAGIRNQGPSVLERCGEPIVSIEDVMRCPNCEGGVEQDSDTLDTWFSSSMWTFSTLGWPEKTEDLKVYHPTSVLETGYDILFFWVAKMILMAGYHLGDIPFKKVYLHGLVRDAQGRKMSKSLGNIIDPLDLIVKYGADATRLSLIIGAGPGNDIKLSEDRVRGYRNFATKIWNATRFVLLHMETPPDKRKVRYGRAEKTMLAKLHKLTSDATRDIERFELHRAADRLYHFFWHYYADKLIEAMKSRLYSEDAAEKETAKALLLEFHTTLLKLLHPFVPFVTEALWGTIKAITRSPSKKSPPSLLMMEKWPNSMNHEV